MWQENQSPGHPGWRGSESVNNDQANNAAAWAMPSNGAPQSMQQQYQQQHPGQWDNNQHAIQTPQGYGTMHGGMHGQGQMPTNQPMPGAVFGGAGTGYGGNASFHQPHPNGQAQVYVPYASSPAAHWELTSLVT